MHIKNLSHYDTLQLRRVILWANRIAREELRVGSYAFRHPPLTIFVVPAGARTPQTPPGTAVLRVHRQTGTEWIALTRQIHGGSTPEELERIPGRGMTFEELAVAAYDLLYRWYKLSLRGRFPPDLPQNMPTLLALRQIKPVPEKRDIVQERYLRVLALEAVWTRRSKLAQTKLKKLRQKRRYYERRLPKREEAS